MKNIKLLTVLAIALLSFTAHANLNNFVEDISGYWSDGASMMEFNFTDPNNAYIKSPSFAGSYIKADLKKYDETNLNLPFFATLVFEDEKSKPIQIGIWTVRQDWDDEGKSFRIGIYDEKGKYTLFNFVRSL